MAQRQYWLDLFTYQTWSEFHAAGASVSGFRENRWKSVQAMKPGDYLLCYLTGVSRWIGLLEVTGPAFQSAEKIWGDSVFPARVPVKVIEQLEPNTAIPVLLMKDQLSFFANLKSPHAWTGWFRGSPALWSKNDGEAVVSAIQQAVRNPVDRPIDLAKLKKLPPILKTQSGKAVTIPSDEILESTPQASIKTAPVSDTGAGDTPEESAHTEIQWLLAKLGSDMGLEIWIAKNDKNKSFQGNSFTSLPKLSASLPLNFDLPTCKTIEMIDVLWLKGSSIVAAFEIESTTQVFSGLLRMADLIAMQPNLAIPLYIVAPNDRRSKVLSETNRPVFSRLEPPMSEMCGFISFEALRAKIKEVSSVAPYLKADFIDSISESCDLEDV